MVHPWQVANLALDSLFFNYRIETFQGSTVEVKYVRFSLTHSHVVPLYPGQSLGRTGVSSINTEVGVHPRWHASPLQSTLIRLYQFRGNLI